MSIIMDGSSGTAAFKLAPDPVPAVWPKSVELSFWYGTSVPETCDIKVLKRPAKD